MNGDTSFMAGGSCRDQPPGIFFPSDGVGVSIAQGICHRCPVREPCLDYALAQRIEHGVWGGVSERGRRRLLQAQRV